ncbi:MAG: hypothetical protein COA82_01005 [Alkaliphilus sp.]|nr:hypothetical protein [Alkaliphilus sp. AH-315-G20]PHS36576.1 MAG: hypothetical protein COA82_01005 [Alkaliphilus sp.]
MKCNSITEQLEKIIFSFLMLFFCSLVISNVMTIYEQRQIVIDINNSYFVRAEKGSVSIKIQGDKLYQDLEIVLNGEVYKRFENNFTVTVEVKNYDVIQINGSMYEEEIYIKIVETSNNINTEKLRMNIKINGNTETLAVIKI